MDVDVVLVNYHSTELLLDCLDTLPAAADGLAVRVTVVDNGSTDDLAGRLAGRGVSYVAMGFNAGFARAVNRGIAVGAAASDPARYVLLLNPDTVLAPAALGRLVAFAESHSELGVCAPQLRNADGTPQLTGRAFPTASAGLFGRRSALTRWFPGNRWSQAFLTDRSRPTGDAAPYAVDWVSGAAMLVPRRVVEQVGGLDEGFFMFWEDADWCRRIVGAGFDVWCVPSAVVVHDEGGTRGHRWSPEGIRRFHAGAYRYWVKHHAPQPWNPLRWVAALLLVARAALLTVANLHLQPSSRQGQVTA